MLRMSKMTDYGFVLLAGLASDGAGGSRTHTARELAERTHVPLPSVSKVLKELSQAGFLVSHRGVAGGYALARSPAQISVAEVIGALEGPLSLTECGVHSGPGAGACELEPTCHLRGHMRVITGVIGDALRRLTLADLVAPVAQARSRLVALRGEARS
ncbi:MAG TPA: SUF system Fe-S cluster assembly regulator [Myxococcales bacterium]|nr:SUF system Fe-S cluster assembly regulator [Myxococcales bacterium]